MKWNSNLRNYLSALTLSTLLAACSSDSIVLEGTVKNLAGRPPRLYAHHRRHSLGEARYRRPSARTAPSASRCLPTAWNVSTSTRPSVGYGASSYGPDRCSSTSTPRPPIRLARRIRPSDGLPRLSPSCDHNVWDLRTRQGDAWNVTKDTIASSVRTTLQEAADAYESAPRDRRRGGARAGGCRHSHATCSSPSNSSTWRPPSATRPTP